MAFQYCSNCYRYHDHTKKCYRVFQCAVIDEEDDHEEEDDYCFSFIGAKDAKEAAERCADIYFCESSEYPRKGHCELTVLVEDKKGLRKHFSVTGEAIVQYTAEEIKE